jgi:oxygen-dependent protoporphyrinogen oxidase
MTYSTTTHSQAKNIVIIGGGITGLSAAYYLKKEQKATGIPLSITLIEVGDKLGGKIITEKVDGFTIEGGPDCFLRQKPWAAELAEEMGIGEDLIGTNDDKRKVYVLVNGKLTPLPDGVMLIIPTKIMPFALSPLISLPGKIRMGMDLFIPPFKGGDDESVGDFIRRRLGKEALFKIAEPLMSGIHVSDPEKQSLMATFPRFRIIEQKHGSLIRGMLAQKKAASHQPKPSSKLNSLFISLKNGVEQLINSLENALNDCRIYKSTKVESINPTTENKYNVQLSNGESIVADAIIMAIPSFNAAELLQSISPRVAIQLETIPYVSTATISMAFRKQDILKPFSGFGFVIPSTENRDISACTWSSIKFDNRAPDDHLLLRCFVGGPGKEAMVELDDEELVRTAHKELSLILDLNADPVFTRVYRWEKANPQYEVGHLERVQEIFSTCLQEIPGIYLTGSAYEGVGIPDCVNQGKKTAAQLLEYIQKKQVYA